MIASVLPALEPDVLTALLWSVCCFGAGVGWAAYRAVGWVDRIRSWAHTVPAPTEKDL